MNTESPKRLAQLEQNVRDLYEAKQPDRADWLYEHHVFVVVERSRQLAERFGVKPEPAMAAAMLHDIADAGISRFDARHGEESLRIAREVLTASGYTPDEMKLIVDDAITRHGCKDGVIPESLEGRVMATADALAHITTDFYHHALWSRGHEGKTYNEAKQWVLAKLERDYHEKILFDDVQQETKPIYETMKAFFG